MIKQIKSFEFETTNFRTQKESENSIAFFLKLNKKEKVENS
jgi:hypothetical protein